MRLSACQHASDSGSRVHQCCKKHCTSCYVDTTCAALVDMMLLAMLLALSALPASCRQSKTMVDSSMVESCQEVSDIQIASTSTALTHAAWAGQFCHGISVLDDQHSVLDRIDLRNTFPRITIRYQTPKLHPSAKMVVNLIWVLGTA